MMWVGGTHVGATVGRVKLSKSRRCGDGIGRSVSYKV